VVRLILWDRST